MLGVCLVFMWMIWVIFGVWELLEWGKFKLWEVGYIIAGKWREGFVKVMLC